MSENRDLREPFRRVRPSLAELALQELPDGVVLVDAFGMVAQMNLAAERLFGRPYAWEPVTECARRYDVLRADGSACPPAEMPLARAALRREHVRDERCFVRRPDGDAVEVSATATPLVGGGAMLVLRNAGHEAMLERRVRERDARLQALIDATTAMTWTTDVHGSCVEDSPSWRAFTGQAVEEYLGLGWIDALHPDDRELARRAWITAVALRQPYVVEYRVRRRDGVYRYTLARGTPVLDLAGAVTGWVGSNQDIHERKMVEARSATLAAVSGAIATHWEDAARMAREVCGAMVRGPTDRCAVFLERDGALVQLGAASNDEGVTVYEGALEEHPLRDGMSFTAEALRTGRTVFYPVVSPQQIANLVRNNQGAPLAEALQKRPPRSIVAAPLRSGGAVRGVLAQVRFGGLPLDPEDRLLVEEVAARLALSLDNLRLLDEAREAVRAREELAAVVAHDLRNPLMAIGNAARLLAATETSDQRARVTLRITHASARASRLVHDLLDFTQARAGRFSLQREPCDLAETLRHCVAEVVLAHPGHEVVAEIEGDCTGTFDQHRLSQVAGNLLGNAVEHSPPGARVTARLRGTPDEVRLEVHNQGVISDAARATLFEAFRRGDVPGRRGSLGLGLYLSRAIARAHGGDIGVVSTPEAGTTFTVTLPR